MFSQFSTRTILRGVLFLIILGTLPFYVIGFIVLGSNGSNPDNGEDISTATTEAPLGADRTRTATMTASPTRNVTATLPSNLQPTPPIFIPPTRIIVNTSTPLPVIIPTDTIAPTFTTVVDTDGDGIVDGQDNCPSQSGPRENSGCPIPDSDGDGVPNHRDSCPDRSGPADLNGCPPDSDGDSILDDQDQCPLVPGLPLFNGCPDPDRDGDGVPNTTDTCPDVAGDPNNGGCPLPETTQQP
jgi:hypothetical protein